MQVEREFLVNVSGSRKVMSVQIAVMTHYDERVFENVKKHEFALRSAIMDVMRQTQEPDLTKPEFRKDLAQKIRDAMNTLLEKFEDFGGIEDVYFTNFIVQ
jgi:flagellar FliL protein